MGKRLSQGHSAVNERFILETRTRKLLPAEIVPVLDAQHHISGFILYVEDLSDQFQKEMELSQRLQHWLHQLIQSVSVIKSTAEIMVDDIDGIRDEQKELVLMLARAADSAGGLLQHEDILQHLAPHAPLPLTPLDAAGWVQFLAQCAAENVAVRLELRSASQPANISIDMHHLTSVLLFIMQKLKQSIDLSVLYADLYVKNSWVYLDFSWQGAALESEMLNRWKHAIPRFDSLQASIPLIDILKAHGAKLWCIHGDLLPGYGGVRLLLPLLEEAEIIPVNGFATILSEARPEFYDFDLFQQAGVTAELNGRLLTELTYTVFDTETTGLDPHGGDEIISIGAVRIVNGRLLSGERFDQLINPRRTLPWSSVKYHGIRPEMLADQPCIEKVLPRFHHFAQDTVLVGHNVAFDLRMMQLKETQTKVRFTNPVLDTMLLSDLIHPAHRKHDLQSIAERLGVRVMGRHTALGDAITTGEIFLKLIPLLAAQGIRTFLEARQASKKSLYARLKY